MIGRALTRRLAADGDEVVRLVRRAPQAPGEVAWDPAAGRLDPAALAGADAVVNLSGASLSRLPWTPAYRREILSSRLDATTTITAALRQAAAAGPAPATLINASAVGFYGSRPGEVLDETSAPGDGFLARVVREWEEAASAAPDGVRTVLARTGVVVGPGGAMRPLMLLTRAGLAGPLGSGRQHWPWISLRDEVGALVHLLRSPVSGPVDLVGPTPATAAELGRALAERMRRPYRLPAPSALIGLLGEAGRELLLADQQVAPAVLLRDGYRFADETVGQAVDALLAGA